MKKSEFRAFINEQVKKALTEASFTKVHYIQIAKILSSSKTVKEVGERLISIFASDNPLFDEKRFRTAAGLPPASGVMDELTLDANHQFDPMDKSIKIENKKAK